MIGQVGPGHVQGEDGSKIKEDTCHHPERRLLYQVYRLRPGKELPEIGQTGDNNNDAFKGYGDIVDLTKVFPERILYKENREQADEADQDTFDRHRLDNLEKKPGKYQQLKWSEEIIEDIHYI